MSLLLVVGDHCFVGRIRSYEDGIAVGPAAAARDALYTGSGLNEEGFFGSRLRSKCAKRRNVVYDPYAPAMRGDYQVVVTRMNRKVANRNVCQFTALVLRPLLATVKRNPQAHFSSHEQKILIHQIFFYYVRIAADGAIASDYRRPCLAK